MDRGKRRTAVRQMANSGRVDGAYNRQRRTRARAASPARDQEARYEIEISDIELLG